MQYRRLEFGRCLKGVWRMSGRYLIGVCKVYIGCLEGTKKVSEKFQNLFDPKIFWGPKILDTNNFGYKLFTQDFFGPKYFDSIIFLDPAIF